MLFVFGTSCGRTGPLLDFRLRRARSASRSKPEAKAVGGSRRSADPVDESEIDSANQRAPSGAPFGLPGRAQTSAAPAAFTRREGGGVRKLDRRAPGASPRLACDRRRARADRARRRLLGRAGEVAAVLDPGPRSGVEPSPRQARDRVVPGRARMPRLRVVPFRRSAAPTRRRLAIA